MTSTRTAGAASGGDAARGRYRAAGIGSLSVLAASLLLGSSLPALAQVDTCTLNPAAVAALEQSIAAGGIVDPDVSFAVGYSLHGLEPVLCTNSAEVGFDDVTEADQIPDQGTIDILAAEQSFLLRYQVNRENGPLEERFCHTVGVEGHTDCFILFSVVAEEEPPPDVPPELFGPVRVIIPANLAAQLGLGEEEAEVQAPIGIASQVCPEGANQLTRQIRETGTAQCTADTIDSEAFRNLVEAQLGGG